MSDTHDVVISGFDLDRIESELALVTEQRDRLADFARDVAESSSSTRLRHLAKQVLSAVKGGSMSETPRTDALWDNQPFGRPFLSEVREFARQLERELAEVTEQRDGAFSLIDYAGELLGVRKQEHKSAHGFKILMTIKELVAAKGGKDE